MRKILSILIALSLLVMACGNTEIKGDGLPDTITESPVKKEQVAEQEAQQDSQGGADTESEMPGMMENGMKDMPMDEMPSMPMHSDVKEFKMEARQFAFVPETIEVNKGDKVRLIVTSIDVPHGIAIPQYGINERLSVGEPVTIEFTADKEGTFTTFCSVACGLGHKDMKGSIVVK